MPINPDLHSKTEKKQFPEEQWEENEDTCQLSKLKQANKEINRKYWYLFGSSRWWT